MATARRERRLAEREKERALSPAFGARVTAAWPAEEGSVLSPVHPLVQSRKLMYVPKDGRRRGRSRGVLNHRTIDPPPFS